MTYKIGSLFSGYSGLDHGVMNVIDSEPVWFVEYDEAPSKILAHHYPSIPNYGDITKVDWASVEPVDILTGGFPCQDVSLAGARRGLKDGTRSGLWSEFAKAIEVLKPRLVVIENVRGLLSAGAAVDELEQCAWCVGDEPNESALRALGAVLGSLADLGYDAEWCGLRAADAGAPHGRYRIFITAWPSEYSDSYSDGFESGGGITRTVTKSQPYRGLGLTTWAERAHGGNLDILPTITTNGTGRSSANFDSLGTLQMLEVSRGELPREYDSWEQINRKVPVAWRDGKAGEIDLLRTPVADKNGGGPVSPAMAKAKGQTLRLTGQIIDLVEPGRLPQPNLPTPTTRDYKDSAIEPAKHRPEDTDTLTRAMASVDGKGLSGWGQYEPAIRRWEAITGREAPAPTIPDGRDGQQRLSPLLTEWMMGLPEGHITSPEIGISRNDQIKAAGNGVVPQQASLALRYLLKGKLWL